MPRNYVDNAMNRNLGRVGMPVGSAVHSRSSGGGSFGGGSYGGGGGGIGGGLSFAGSSSSRTYVDNAMNQRLGRVGLPVGSAVHSRSGGESSASLGFACGGYESSSSGSSSGKTYVDNAANRKLGRVGMEHGTAVHSKSDASPKKTYVDNPMNRKLDRVGMEHGTAVHSKKEQVAAAVSQSARPKTSESVRKYVDNPQNQSSTTGVKLYKDNYLNRKLGRANKPFGSMPQRKDDGEKIKNTTEPKQVGAEAKQKVYVDSYFNRKHNRVGKPLGSVPISSGQGFYQDTPLNRYLNRVGKPWGTHKVSKGQLAELRRYLAEGNDEDFPPKIVERYENDPIAFDEAIDHLDHLDNRRDELEKAQDEGLPIMTEVTADLYEKFKNFIFEFDDLELRSVIGRGGFGEVYSASINGEMVAVKKLLNQKLTKKRLNEFESEIRLYMSLNHPNIVKCYGACIERPNLAIVMEIMDISLGDALHVEPVEFRDWDKLKITCDIVNGMEYLHSQNIAHCDLKSQNILLDNVRGFSNTDDDDADLVAKITDFGLSRMKSDVSTSSSHRPGIGTPRYSAPEVLRGELLNVSALMKADIYSVGLLIWELTVEEIPFEDFDLMQLRSQIGERGLKPSFPKVLPINPAVKSLLNQCWEFQAKERPQAEHLFDVAVTLDHMIAMDEE